MVPISRAQFDGSDIACETPVRLWTRYQLTGNERPTSESPRWSVGITRRDHESTNGDNGDEDQDSDCNEQFTNDVLTNDVHSSHAPFDLFVGRLIDLSVPGVPKRVN